MMEDRIFRSSIFHPLLYLQLIKTSRCKLQAVQRLRVTELYRFRSVFLRVGRSDVLFCDFSVRPRTA